jgi:hypothetical protein
VASPHRATPGGANPRAPGAATCDAPTMDPRVSGVWRLPEPDDARLPLLYSLKATRD